MNTRLPNLQNATFVLSHHVNIRSKFKAKQRTFDRKADVFYVMFCIIILFHIPTHLNLPFQPVCENLFKDWIVALENEKKSTLNKANTL